MFLNTLKLSAKIACSIIFVDDSDNPEDQLDQLSVGYGHVIADGEQFSAQEAEQAQSRGELYDTYY